MPAPCRRGCARWGRWSSPRLGPARGCSTKASSDAAGKGKGAGGGGRGRRQGSGLRSGRPSFLLRGGTQVMLRTGSTHANFNHIHIHNASRERNRLSAAGAGRWGCRDSILLFLPSCCHESCIKASERRLHDLSEQAVRPRFCSLCLLWVVELDSLSDENSLGISRISSKSCTCCAIQI